MLLSENDRKMLELVRLNSSQIFFIINITKRKLEIETHTHNKILELWDMG